MTTIGPLAISTGSAVSAGGMRAGRVEKCAESRDSNGEYREGPEPRDRRMANTDRRAVSHDGTGRAAPLWHGPRLRAPFVAQVIGQVLVHADAAPTAAVYGAGRAPVATVVDNRA